MFDYDAACGTFTPATSASEPPQGHDAKCGAACPHTSGVKGLHFHGIRQKVNPNSVLSKSGSGELGAGNAPLGVFLSYSVKCFLKKFLKSGDGLPLGTGG